MKVHFPKTVGIACLLILALSGCDNPSGRIRRFVEKWDWRKSPRPVPSAALNSVANSELLSEMYQVVFQSLPQGTQAFSGYVENLDQGASFEGIYNGFAHSADYRELETATPGTSTDALQFFAAELAEVEEALPIRSRMDAGSAKPLPILNLAAAEEEPVPAELAFDSPAPRPSARDAWAAEYEKIFRGASIYTLKRVLGDELLKLIDVKKAQPRELADWYSRWAAKLARKNIGFGLDLRNKADEAFHRQWARHAPLDLLSWEVLNRAHRVLNELDKKRKKT
jgi:hypothetical protein